MVALSSTASTTSMNAQASPIGMESRIQGNASQSVGFPESFQRSSVQADEDLADDSDLPTSPCPYSPCPSTSEEQRAPQSRSPSPVPRFRRNSVMRLENILNDISIGHAASSRSRSLDARPPAVAQTEPEAPSELSAGLPSTPSSTHLVSSTTPEGRPAKKKKVKMHYCPECQKGFPRPSGLRTHMNMHTKEKPYPCRHPGCTRSFSVVSNAKRHMRTHGVYTMAETEPVTEQYVVGFEEPVVAGSTPPDDATAESHPLKLKWVGSASSGETAHGHGVGSQLKGKRSSRDLDEEYSTP